MKNKKYNVVIVGSGFSGIVAAEKLSDSGLKILMIDENFHIGGQLLRKIPEKLGTDGNYHPDYIKKTGNRFIGKLNKDKIDIINNATVIGIYDNNEILIEVEKERVVSVHYDMILFATGARERYLPFRGWTLPGVYSAGMAQVLMKSSGVLPSRDMVVAGSGLFLFSAAYELIRNGARVRSVIESTGMLDKIRMLPVLLHNLSKVAEGIRYISKIGFSMVPIRHRTKIIEARGEGALKEVVVSRTDGSGRIIEGKERIIKTGGLAYSFGFVPNIELPNLAGCRTVFDRGMGGWIVEVGPGMETSVPGIYCAGEVTGVGGALKSINEGETAALSILEKLEAGEKEKLEKRKNLLIKKRKHHLSFARHFNTLYGITEQDVLDIQDEAVVCRCEDVTMGDIRDALVNGFMTPGALKISVRSGMGNCQGRTCGPVIYDLLGFMPGIPKENFSLFSNRPPVKPVKIGSLMNSGTDR